MHHQWIPPGHSVSRGFIQNSISRESSLPGPSSVYLWARTSIFSLWLSGKQVDKTLFFLFLKKKIVWACSLGKLCAETSMALSDSSSSELIGEKPTTQQALGFDVETLQWSSALLTCICYLALHIKALELICLTLWWLALKLFQVGLVTSWHLGQDLCSQATQSITVVFISEPYRILNWTHLSRNVCHIV